VEPRVTSPLTRTVALYTTVALVAHVVAVPADAGEQTAMTTQADSARTTVEDIQGAFSGGVVTITYDLTGFEGQSAFDVVLEVSTNGGQTYDVQPRSMNGNVGRPVSAGRGKQIVWEFAKDVVLMPRLEGKPGIEYGPIHALLMAGAHPDTIDKFQILQALGEGGMGRLYLGRDPDIGRLVAIKLLREGLDTEEFRQRFVREAQSASALRHANIVTIFHAGTHDRAPFIVMEYIQGETLADLVARRRLLPLARKLQLMDEIATGLQYAHRKGIVHRDIKPANIMLDEDGVVRILDFGIARIHGSGLTQSGAVIGTLNYMAPEQLAGEPVDSRADVFSAGAVFYELLAYQRAFPGSFPEILQKIMTDAPPPLERLDPQLDTDVIAVVNRCLAKRADDRYPDFGAVRAALDAVRARTADSSVESTVLVHGLRGRGGRDEPDRLRSSDVRLGPFDLHVTEFLGPRIAWAERDLGPVGFLKVRPMAGPIVDHELDPGRREQIQGFGGLE